VLHGLSKPEFNGLLGTIISKAKNGRLAVQVDGHTKPKSLKPINLKLADTVNFTVGNYEVVHETFYLAKANDLGSEKMQVCYPGEIVNIVEIRNEEKINRIRGKVENMGWLSIKTTGGKLKMQWLKKTNKSLEESQSTWCKDLSDEFYEALCKNDFERLNRLLKKGADINKPSTTSEEDFNPLGVAVSRGQFEVAKFLIDNGANVNYKNAPRDEAALLIAVSNKTNAQVKIIKYLCASGADVNAKTNSGCTAVSMASFHNNLPVLTELVSQQNADVNESIPTRFQPLFAACLKGDLETCRFLLEHNADPNARAPASVTPGYEDSEYPIEQACKEGQLELVQLLLKFGAQVNGTNALRFALQQKHFHVAKFLIEEQGVDLTVRMQGFFSVPVLSVMIRNEHYEAIEFLLQYQNINDANISIFGPHRIPVLALCADQGQLKMSKFLFLLGADPSITVDGEEYGPMVTAVAKNHLNLLLYFLEHDKGCSAWFARRAQIEESKKEKILALLEDRILHLIEVENIISQTLFPKHDPVIAQIVNLYTHGIQNLTTCRA
jgi:ankyrin repeat protein